MRYVINGSFLLGSVLGVQRYAREITAQLDKLVKGKEYDVEIALPSVDSQKTSVFVSKYQNMYENIRVVEIGGKAGRRWEQINFDRYVKRTGAKPIYLCNEVSLFMKNGIVVVHDIAFKTHPNFFTESGDWHEIIFRRMMYAAAFHRADAVITVSRFSKKEILSNYRLKNSDIVVAGNGWQHFKTDNIDEHVFDQYASRVKRGNYYFYMASLAPNKNIDWILKNAQNNPESTYVIAGKSLGVSADKLKMNNVVYVGYVSDATAKALMKYCKAFLFPSTYEGFGIPPMEALCMGAKVVVGDIPVMHEIYEDVVKYVDCTNPQIKLDTIIDGWFLERSRVAEVLNKHSWADSAEKLCECMDREAV